MSASSSRKKQKKTHGAVNGAAAPAAAAPTTLDSPFKEVDASLKLSIPPVFAGNLAAGAHEMLDSLIMRYSPALDAVLLAYSHLTFEDATADIQNDCPFAVIEVSFKAVVWSPQIGHRLSGSHSISSSSHISLILYRTFNVSIPIDRIPLDKYTFDESIRSAGADSESDSDDDEEHSSGRWKDAQGNVLGDDGDIEFTVTGKQISNQMLSLTGSLMGFAKSSETTHAAAPLANGSIAATAAANAAQSAASTSARLPTETSVGDPETQSKSSKKSKRTKTIGVDIASRDQVDHALHEAQPAVQPSDPFAELAANLGAPPHLSSTSADEEKRLRKEKRRAEKKAAKEAAAAAASGSTSLQPIIDVKEEMLEEAAKKKSRKSKRSADDAPLAGEVSKKRKKA